MAEAARKRRKWDVAAPGAAAAGMTAGIGASNRPGIGAGAGLPAQFAGFVTGQGLAAAVKAELAPAPKPVVATYKPGEPLAEDVIKRAQAGAAAAMEKINRDLLAKGLLAPNKAKQLGLNIPSPIEELPEFGQDIIINSAPPQVRYLLTKRTTQDEIQRRTGTNIVNKGRYMPPGSQPSDTDKPLFLRVVPGGNLPHAAAKQAAVKLAVQDIRTLMTGHPLVPRPQPNWAAMPPDGWQNAPPPDRLNPPPGPRPPMGAPPPGAPAAAYNIAPPPAAAAPTVQLYVGFDSPPEFNLALRLKGPGNSYFDHIAKETSSALQLRGKGSIEAETPEPLHVYISSSSQKGLEEARSLTQNLIDTVKGDFQTEYPNAPLTTPPPAQQPAYPGYAPNSSQAPYAGQPPAYGLPPSAGNAASGAPGQPPPSAQPYGSTSGVPPSSGAPQQPPYGAPPSSQQAGSYPPPSSYPPPGQQMPPGAQLASSYAAPYGAPPPGYGAQVPPPDKAAPATSTPPSSGAPFQGQQQGQGQYPYAYPPPGSQPPASGGYGSAPLPYASAPPAAGYVSAGPPGQQPASYPPPSQAPYYPPPGQTPYYPAPGQYQPPGGTPYQPPPSQQGAPPSGYGLPLQGGQPQGGGQQQAQPQKRRFREFKEGAPPSQAPQVNPYQQPQLPHQQQQSLQQQQGPPQQAQHGPQPQPPPQQNGAMGPPPLRAMGPPPPRAMGPPPPRQSGGMGPPPPRNQINAGSVDATGGMALVDYGDED